MPAQSPFEQNPAGSPELRSDAPSVPPEYWPNSLGEMLPGVIVFVPVEFITMDKGTRALYLNMGAGLDALAEDPPSITDERIAVMRVMGPTFGAPDSEECYIVDISGLNQGDLPMDDVPLMMAHGTEMRAADVLVVSDLLGDRTVDYRFARRLEPFAGGLKPIAQDVNTQTIIRMTEDVENTLDALRIRRGQAGEPQAAPGAPVRVARPAGSCVITRYGVHHAPRGQFPGRDPFRGL